MSEQYLDQIIDEIYHIVTRGADWPKGFNGKQRIRVLENIMLYYQSLDTHEGYTKCAKLRDLIDFISQADKYRMNLGDSTKSGSIDLFRN